MHLIQHNPCPYKDDPVRTAIKHQVRMKTQSRADKVTELNTAGFHSETRNKVLKLNKNIPSLRLPSNRQKPLCHGETKSTVFMNTVKTKLFL